MTAEIYRRTDRSGYVVCAATNGVRLAEISPKGQGWDGWWFCVTPDGSQSREMWQPYEPGGEFAALELVVVRFLSGLR
ncbi:hypothetical protein [Actinomadura rupiterrae]|uniref:hypothetical protein n=1 Tax=Actinomadura rupiterrae TaxID=559627 RepID=UPI0020A4E800|nr:hypothetical protein [Actinomadura rupiterrae]MCP2336712.1 hypothetical protein [Actinomadura rupiterrae]